MLLQGAAKKLQMHSFLRVSMSDTFDQITDNHFDPQFLAQFSHEAFFKRFIRLAFAARELPEAAEMGIGPALSNQ